MNINLTSAQARNFGNMTWLQMIKQPPDNMRYMGLYDKYMSCEDYDTETSGNKYAVFQSPDYDDSVGIKLPFAIGDIVGCRETWDYDYDCDEEDGFTKVYVYKADLPREDWYAFGWFSPVTMPREAIRKWLKITGMECKRVQEISPDLASHYFIDTYKYMTDRPEDAFRQWFNDKYAKPRPVREHGGIVGYKAYAYDNSKESMEIFDKYLMGDYWYYKDLPLEIIPNPYIVIYTGEECEKA